MIKVGKHFIGESAGEQFKLERKRFEQKQKGKKVLAEKLEARYRERGRENKTLI